MSQAKLELARNELEYWRSKRAEANFHAASVLRDIQELRRFAPSVDEMTESVIRRVGL